MSRALDAPPVFWLALVALLAIGTWARLATHEHILVGGRVELVPADSHYYVRLALLHLRAGALVDVDPFVAFPFGAANYWPPLHTLLVTMLAGLARDPELGAAFAGPVAGIIGLGITAIVARSIIGPRAALATAFLLALTPIAIESAAIGNADHHVHEPILVALTMLLAIPALRGSPRAAVGTGVIVGGARLFTTVGFVLVPIVAIAYVLAAWVARAEDRARMPRLAVHTGVAATATTALAVLMLGHPASLEYEALSLFHVLLAAASFGACTAICAWMAGDRRLAVRGAVAALTGLPLAVQTWRALGHLGRADPLLAIIAESRSLLAHPGWAMFLFGPVLLALPFGLFGAGRRMLRLRTPWLAAPLLGTVLFLAAAAQQARFAPMLAGAAAVLLPLGVPALLASWTPRVATWAWRVVAVGAASLLFVLIPPPPPRTPGPARMIRPTLLWMQSHLPPAAADPFDPDAQPDYGILAPFEYGHFITLYAERPALASTFSQTSSLVLANRVATEILGSTDEDDAFRRLREARLRYVLRAPTVALLGLAAPSREALYLRLQRDEALGRFRPIFRSREERAPGRPYATVYEVVEGAVLEGSSAPGARIEVALDSLYVRRSVADRAGRYGVRVSREGTYRVSGGGAPAMVTVTEAEVREGARIGVPVRP